MTTRKTFDQFWEDTYMCDEIANDLYRGSTVEEIARNSWKAALTQPNEAVGNVYHEFNSETGGYNTFTNLFVDLPHNTKLYLSPPDKTAKIKELEAERDMIFGLLKQLRATLFNMCNEEKSDLEWIYETNMVMKEIDVMFLHGYLQDSKTELANLQKQNDVMREALQLLRDNQNGCPLPKYENDWNEAMRLTDIALATVKGE